MSTFAQMAHDNRNAAIKSVQDLYESAADEGRDLTPEEQEQADRMEADIQNWAAKRDKALRAESLAIEGALARGDTAERVEKAVTAPVEDNRTAWDLFKKGAHLVISGGSYTFDFARDGRDAYLETRALQSQGGSAVATEYSTQVEVFLRTETPLLDPGVVTVVNTPDGHPILLPRLTADPNHGGTITAEAGGINELDSTISSVTLGAFKYGITNLLSRELFDDANFDISSLLAESSARELAIDINVHLTTGTGTVQPQGIVAAATAGFTATGTASGSSTDTFFSPADILDLYYSLPNSYRVRRSLAWMGSTLAVAKMRKFRDSNKGFIWDTSLVAGQPDRFNGIPIFENAAMADPASASKSVIVGDLKAFKVRVVPLRVEMSRDYKFGSDQIAIRNIMRVDSNLPDAAAVRYLVSANT